MPFKENMKTTVLILGFLLPCVWGEFTLLGDCQDVKLQENLDYTKFSGIWYNIASFASDGRPISDCATLDFQEDNLGYTLRETYVDVFQGNRTQKSYFARVDPTFDAGSKAKFIISHGDGDKVLQFPFFILYSDYDNFAIAYTCKSTLVRQKHENNDAHIINIHHEARTSVRKHYVFAWVLSRNKDGLKGATLQEFESILSKYSELAEYRKSFVFKDFSEPSCSYVDKFESDFFTGNFW